MNIIKGILGWFNRYRSVFVLTFASFVFLAAQSSFWINQTIFDQATFTTITKDVLATEESRHAIAKTVVDTALEERPIAKRVAGDKATQLVTGLLGTDLASQTISTVLDKSYAYLTSDEQEPIDIDLLPIKTPLAGLVSFAESQGREVQFDPESIPDTIVLFDPSNLPDIHAYSQKMLVVGPLCWLISLGLFAAYIYRGRRALTKRVYIIGAVIIATCFFGLLTGPMLPPTIAALVPVTELRPVVADLVAALLAPFSRQMFVTVGITLVVLAIFNQRHNIASLVQKLVGSRKKPADSQAKVENSDKTSTKKSTALKKPGKKARSRR